MRPKPHSKALRQGRSSQPGFRYFITFKVKPVSASLITSDYFNSRSKTVDSMESESQINETSFTIMPDHIHMIFRPGSLLSLSQVISKTKQLSRSGCPLPSLHWQSGYYDHKLRNEEGECPILHYMYMNPYQGKRISSNEKWPYFRCYPKTWSWLKTTLDRDCPYPEWIAK